MTEMPMRELIEFLAKSLVDNPDEVKTRTYERDSGTVVELEVAPADLGKVIGRQGRTARAIRTLLTAAGQKTRRRYSLDIVD
jgi:predicted RNA-binding protein YlqC (UPF0109 family)